MGFTHKKTDERLDKIVQTIHHFQNLNNGDTPKQRVIGNELGIPEGRINHYINLLESDKRIERISIRPWRVRLLDHPKNRAAIRRLERALAAADAAAAGQPVSDGIALPPSAPVEVPAPSPDVPAPSVAEEPAPPAPAKISRASLPYPKPKTLWEAEQNLQAVGVDPKSVHGRDVITLPTIKTAPTGMLLEELLDRGYTISKGR